MPKLFTTLLLVVTILSFVIFGRIEHSERHRLASKPYVLLGPAPNPAPNKGTTNGQGETVPSNHEYYPPVPPPPPPPSAEIREWMQPLLSLALLGAALFVILGARFGPKDKHWAYGIVGTIAGFWMRS